MPTITDESHVVSDRTDPGSSEFLTETGRRISDDVAAIIPLLRQQAFEAERSSQLTDEVAQALSATGAFNLTTPIEYGGYALGARDLLEVIRTIARGDGSAAWLAASATGNNVMVLSYPKTAIDEVYGGSEGWVGPLLVGASIFATRVGSAREVENGWMVKGRWGFGTGCKHAAWAMVGVDYSGVSGSGRGQVLLRRDQYTILDDWQVSGLGATSSNTITAADEVFVPADRFFDMADLPVLQDGLARKYQGAGFRWPVQARVLAVTLSSAAIALGLASASLEALVEQAAKRKPFNLPYPTVAETPSTQVSAGKIRAMVNAATAVVERHADAIDRRSLEGRDFSESEATERHMDLIYAAQLCAEAADLVQVVLGSSTVSLRNPVQRNARDLRVLTTHGAIRLDPMAEISGRDVLGLPPFSMFAGGLPNRA